MITRTFFTSLLIMIVSFAWGQKAEINRADFYAAMASDKLEIVNGQQELLRSSDVDNKEAFEGALLMKKAGLVGKASEKLSLFKSGHKLLDNAIKNDATNAELRFLRLMIQEHAPKIVKYKGNIDGDSTVIRQGFHQLLPSIQKAIIDYSKNSKILKPTDF